MKKIVSYLLSTVLMFGIVFNIGIIPVNAASSATNVAIFRLYNPNSGEHFYTPSQEERDLLIVAGWKGEGYGWMAPASSNSPVYRLYNPNSGDHHYTTDEGEKNWLVNEHHWNYEGIGWYSDDAKSVPLYRQFNPNVSVGTHNYTKSLEENDWLCSIGWNGEGIGWYGVNKEFPAYPDEPETENKPTNGKYITYKTNDQSGYCNSFYTGDANGNLIHPAGFYNASIQNGYLIIAGGIRTYNWDSQGKIVKNVEYYPYSEYKLKLAKMCSFEEMNQIDGSKKEKTQEEMNKLLKQASNQDALYIEVTDGNVTNITYTYAEY